MDTTQEVTDPIERVSQLLTQVAELDAAEAIGPLTEVADILETLLDAEDGL